MEHYSNVDQSSGMVPVATVERIVEDGPIIIDNIDFCNFPPSFEVRVGLMFHIKECILLIMRMIAIRNNFEFRTVRSDKTRLYLECSQEDTCKWMFRASTLNGDNLIWVIRNYNGTHNCMRDISTNKHNQATAEFVGVCLTNKLGDVDILEKFQPRDVAIYMLKEFGVETSYYKAWRGRQLSLISLRGSAEDSYRLLPSLAEALRLRNPGTHIGIKINDDQKFKYFFISFGASISGWRSCRPVFSVDGAHLSESYKGTLMMAAAKDSNNHIFPLAFGIVDSENDDAWTWFFQRLHEAIGDRDELVIVSDRHCSIPKAVAAVYPYAEHGHCAQHLKKNLIDKYKYPSLTALFDRAARAYTKQEFDYYMAVMGAMDKGIVPYLMKAEPFRWARSHFRKKRYEMMTTNISESLNAVLVGARGRPIISLVESYRKMLQRWFYERRAEGSNMPTRLTTFAEVMLYNQEEYARKLMVTPIDVNQFEISDHGVQHVVDVMKKTCTCSIWDLEDFPCFHAIASLWKKNIVPSGCVSKFYLKEMYLSTYKDNIFPSGIKLFDDGLPLGFSDIASSSKNPSVMPPEVKKQ